MLDKWKSLWLGHIWVLGVSSSSHEGSWTVADTSSKMASSPGGELGSLCSL